MMDTPESLELKLTDFTVRNGGGFSYLTLIQENSEFVMNPFHHSHPAKEKSRADIVEYLDQFFSIYAKTFDGNEREDVHKILGRILPSSYLKQLKNDDTFFQKTREALCATIVLGGSGAETSSKPIPSAASELFAEIEHYNSTRMRREAADNSQNDQTFITLCLAKTSAGMRVIGGMILEYYSSRMEVKLTEKPLSHCILTYLFFEDDYREKGVGTYFIREILPIITKNQIRIKGREGAIRPSYVFFEVDNPMYAQDKENQSSEEEADIEILDFFRSVGAKWLDICYVQPKLSTAQGRAYNLLFMILPEVSDRLETAFTINKYDVLTFITDFYKNHEGNDPKFNLPTSEFLADGSKMDVDLYRSYLTIETADAIDDFENNLIYDKVMELRAIQKDLEAQLDFISDMIKITDSANQSLITTFLEPVFKEGIDSSDKFTAYKNEFLDNSDMKNIFYDVADINTIIEAIVKKKNTLDFRKNGIKSLVSIAKSLSNIVAHQKTLAIQNNDWFYLKELPRFESPKLQFDKSSVSFQIALNSFVDSKYFSIKNTTGNVDPYRFSIDSDPEKLTIENAKLLHLRAGEHIIPFAELDCPIFKSYENDLLSFNYYEEKSRTKNKFVTTFSVEVTFPYKIEFLSEGRKECVFLNVKPDTFAERLESSEVKYFAYKKRLKGFLNVKCFKNDTIDELSKKYEQIREGTSNNYDASELDLVFDYEVGMAKGLVWNVVFTNDRDEMYKRIPLSEYEIIALAKHFSGKQERTFIELEFNKVESKSKNFQPLLNDVFDIIRSKTRREKNVLYDIHSGIIQIDTLNTQIFSTKADNKFVPLFESEYRNGLGGKKGGALRQKENAMRERDATKRNIMVLLEEYLKDHVDNIELLNQLYRKGDPDEEVEISYTEVYRNARDFHLDNSFTGFEDRYRKNNFLNYFFNALCGISLGIYDFHRMGYEEVTDTITPLEQSANDNSMIIMKRASVFSCCHDNSVFDSSIETIGMSPYLIIPNAVLVYNRVVSDHFSRFQKNIMQLLDDEIDDEKFIRIREDAKKELNFSKSDVYPILLRFRKRTEAHIDGVYIPNIFNYATEQEIYSEGTRDRGIDEVHNRVKTMKTELDERITEVVEVRNNIYSLLVTIFLGMFSFTSFYELLHGKVEKTAAPNLNIPAAFRMSVGDIVFYMSLWIFIFYFGSRLVGILPRYIVVDIKQKYLFGGGTSRSLANITRHISHWSIFFGKFLVIPVILLALTAGLFWLLVNLFALLGNLFSSIIHSII